MCGGCTVRKQERTLRRKLALQAGEGDGEEEEEEPDDEDAATWGARKPAYYGEDGEVRLAPPDRTRPCPVPTQSLVMA